MEAQAKLERKKLSKAKLGLLESFELISRAISNEGPQGVPEFPVKLHVMEHARGDALIYEEMPGQVLCLRSLDFVVRNIITYTSRVTPKGMFPFTVKKAKECALYWFNHTHRLETEILPVAQASEIGYCYHRLTFDLKFGESPTWEEMFTRMSNYAAVAAFIGSMLVHNSDRQQYCWIYGAGGNGKSAISRFLHRLFNGAYRAEIVPDRQDKFWLRGLLGARCVVFPDTNNYNFPTTGLFKQVTGDDVVRMERKHADPFSAKLTCKLLFLSNQRPNITSEFSDVRRAIYCEMQPIKGPVIPTHEYDEMLWKEAPSFLASCIDIYNSMCPSHGPIPVKGEIVDELTADNEEEWIAKARKMFAFESTDAKNSAKTVADRAYISPESLQEILSNHGFSRAEKRSFIAFLARRFGVKKTGVKVEGQTEYRYLGLLLENYSMVARKP